MPQFSPFTGIHYSPSAGNLADLSAPPYDVIDDRQRAELAAQHRYNAVHIDLPVDSETADRYEVARALWQRWLDEGVLVRDDEPVLYGYRMAFAAPTGRARRTTGVLGSLELSRPGEGRILPHEHTTPKAKSDRLEMLRSCRANLSPIWGLCPTSGLTQAIGEPSATAHRWTDEDGVTHTFWTITDPDRLRAIASAVDANPLVVADGHHRYETSLTYRDERRSESPDNDAGPAESTLAFVVELVAEELTVLPIHRLIDGLALDTDLMAVLEAWFEPGDDVAPAPDLLDQMIADGFLVLVEPGRLRSMRPRPGVFDQIRDLDTVRLDTALRALGEHQLSYQHGIDNVVDAVGSGRAQAGVLVRPATVAQIAATADGGERMPPKTTFFHPKPKTGLVFRSLD